MIFENRKYSAKPVPFNDFGESGRGLPHSKRWRDILGPKNFRQALECGSPLPLSWGNRGFTEHLLKTHAEG